MGSNVQVAVNPWELKALNHQYPDNSLAAVDTKPTSIPRSGWREMPDPVFFPGLYSASGYDLMAILVRLMSRSNPQIELGPVDCSVALVLCDLEVADEPIVYVTDAFCELTGYSKAEVLGRNCRFLQTQYSCSSVKPRSETKAHRKTTSARMRRAIRDRKEVQLKVVNYRKNGERFNNLISIIPLEMDDSGYQYAVGFAVEVV
ncbi:hypothetical protein QQS21_006247 [Conoideocrella luteorostrata]|uniref:PAS domain-containing protein n=1 Tax=Conoideocrella luteorostrata TaxID=1105319 RepID=A0AAJ0CMY5_9HYPO|nr:hypothetical protein QQS21_006247 [Conoideocrella luteorostrata]